MRRAVTAALVGTSLALVGCEREPDVLVLFVDTLRHDHVGCGNAVGALPSLETFLSEGTCFDRVASTAGWTLPVETSMLVSAYPEEHGVDSRHSQVSSDVVAVTAPLFEAGYQTALVSGNVLTTHPQYQPYFDYLWVIDRTQEFAADVDTQVVDEALRWLDDDAGGSPLFLVLQLYGPHYPYCPPGVEDGIVQVDGLHEGEVDLCDPNQADILRAAEEIVPFPEALSSRIAELYAAEVASTAVELDRFLAGWDEHRGRPRITVVVTDHGEAFGEHGTVLHGRSLHRETSDCHMGFHGAGIAPQVVDRPVELLDLAPTLTALLDLEPADAWRGMNLTPLFDDPGFAFTARAYQVSTLLDATQRAVTLEGDEGRRYRLLTWDDGRDPELYDATTDPKETLDLYGDPTAAGIQEKLELFLEDMVVTAATGGPPRDP